MLICDLRFQMRPHNREKNNRNVLQKVAAAASAASQPKTRNAKAEEMIAPDGATQPKANRKDNADQQKGVVISVQ